MRGKNSPTIITATIIGIAAYVYLWVMFPMMWLFCLIVIIIFVIGLII